MTDSEMYSFVSSLSNHSFYTLDQAVHAEMIERERKRYEKGITVREFYELECVFDEDDL